jgi:hypothetical protein
MGPGAPSAVVWDSGHSPSRCPATAADAAAWRCGPRGPERQDRRGDRCPRGSLGYTVSADERPARVVLESDDGRVDLHPIVHLPSGAGVQTGFDGQTFEYPPGSLEAEGEIGWRMVRCGTPDLQVTFHRAYEPRQHDRQDMAALAEAFDLTLEPPYSD